MHADYTVQGEGSGSGIGLSGRTNVTIKNMEIKTFDYGIYLGLSNRSTVSGANITNNNRGIWFVTPSNNSISGNNIACMHDANSAIILFWGMKS